MSPPSPPLSPSPIPPLSPPSLPPLLPPFFTFLSRPLPLPSPLLKPLHAIAVRSAATVSTSLLLSLHTRLILSAAAASSSSSLFPYAIRLLLHPSLPIPLSSFSWNSLLRLLAFSPTLKPLALSLFLLMLLHSSPPPDHRSFPFVLKACAHLFALRLGSQIHSYIIKLGFASDTFVANSLIHFYCSCNFLQLARKIFDEMPHRTQVSWNVMIDGYAVAGDYNAALDIFREMQSQLFRPDVYTVQSLLAVSGGLGALSIGIWVHAFLIKRLDSKAKSDILVNNSLIDLYSRCGSLSMARQVFDEMPERDVASWNTMILGLASHGCIQECFDAFNAMLEAGNLRPNSITFVAVLSACNHGGLVTQGFKFFHLFTNNFGIDPRLEHYGCLINLFARAGLVDAAIEFVRRMPFKPDAVIWRSLLHACWRRRARIELSESMALQALESDQNGDSGAYVLLSKIYASANRWNEVGLIRNLMAEEGIRKEPGFSSLEINGTVHEFVAGDTSHPRSEEIYRKLEEVERRISMAGYACDPTEAPMVAGREKAKRDCLRLHSERLAMAFGLMMNGSSGRPMRILKNLRVCGDCHNAAKLISGVYGVEIILRDRFRFHCFKDGS